MGETSKLEHLLQQLSFYVLILIMRYYYSGETFHTLNIVSKSAYLHFSWNFLWHAVFSRKHLSLGFSSLRGGLLQGHGTPGCTQITPQQGLAHAHVSSDIHGHILGGTLVSRVENIQRCGPSGNAPRGSRESVCE